MFVSKYSKLTESLFHGLYDVLNIYIRQAGKDEARGPFLVYGYGY